MPPIDTPTARPSFSHSAYSYPPLPTHQSARYDNSRDDFSCVPALPSSASYDSTVHRGILRDVLICMFPFCDHVSLYMSIDPQLIVFLPRNQVAAFSVVECLCSANGIPFGPNLRAFITSVVKSSRTTSSILRVALYYLIRVRDSLTTLKEKIPSGRCLFLASLILAFKYLHDKTFSTRGWSKISECTVHEVNFYEISMLDVLNWRLHVPVETFEQWDKFLFVYRPLLMRCLQFHSSARSQPYLHEWNYAILSVPADLSELPQPSHLMPRGSTDLFGSPSPTASLLSSSPSIPQSTSARLSPTRLSRLTPVPATGSLSLLRPETDVGILPTPAGTPLSTRKLSPLGHSISAAVVPLSAASQIPQSFRPFGLQKSYTFDQPRSSESYDCPSSLPDSLPSRRGSVSRSAGWSMSPTSSVFDSGVSGSTSASSLDFSYTRRDSAWGGSSCCPSAYDGAAAHSADHTQEHHRPVICTTLSTTPEAYADHLPIVMPLKSSVHQPPFENRKRRRSSTSESFAVHAGNAWNNCSFAPTEITRPYPRHDYFRHQMPGHNEPRHTVPYGGSPHPSRRPYPTLVTPADD